MPMRNKHGEKSTLLHFSRKENRAKKLDFDREWEALKVRFPSGAAHALS